MKKSKLLCCVALTSLMLFGCSNSQTDEKISKLEKRVEKLENAIQYDPEAHTGTSDNARDLESENTKGYSGVLEVGVDIDEGTYNITVPDGQEEGTIIVYNNRDEAESNATSYADYQWLRSAKDTDYKDNDDVLQNYKINKGKFLKIEGNLNFTKTN